MGLFDYLFFGTQINFQKALIFFNFLNEIDQDKIFFEI